MKAAAAEVGTEIFIGAVASESSGSGPANWNVDMMKEMGDVIDYYIIHSYFTPYNQNSNADVILKTPAQTQGYFNYLTSCATQAGQAMKPLAMTEYNIFAIGSKQMVSQIGGMFAVMVTGEAIKTGLGAICRWDLANGYSNGDDHGMYSYGDEPGVTRFSPRPAFYYLYYMQKYLGDVMLKTSIKGTTYVKAYSSAFSSGHISTILANAGVNAQTVRVNIDSATIGERFYIYTLTGGTDVPADPLKPFSRKVIVNGEGPTEIAGGPLNYETLKAKSTVAGDEILIEMPPFSVVYMVADTGTIELVKNDTVYPVVKWNNPASITYGTLLSATQLNATANMSGSFVYDPPAGTKLDAGSDIELKVTFTPNDTVYSAFSKTVYINVGKVMPVIQWATPADIPDGTALDENQLNAATGIDGLFEYVPPAGTVLSIGNAQVLQVTFTPADTVNYNIVSKTVHINVYQVTGSSELNAEEISLFPVPVSGTLTVSGLASLGVRQSIQLQVVAMDGSVVYKTDVQQGIDSKTIQVSGLPGGMYMLQLISEGRLINRRFTKQ
jgi:hypothetical protein